jgi:hypothetical protein
MGGSFGSDGSAGSARAVERLLLRFWLPGRPYEEVYVDRRLFIGRVEGNDIQIPDEAVDRQHARVDFRGTDTEGQWVLECLRPDGFVEADGRRHHRLVLQPGLRFTVGPCQFECLAEPVAPKPEQDWPVAPKPEQDWSVCPHCRSEQARRLAEGMGRCPACGGEVVVLQDGSGRPAVLPVEVLGCRLLRLIDQGGMAWVFEARLKDRADLVAVKILKPHLLADDPADRYPDLRALREDLQEREILEASAISEEEPFGMVPVGPAKAEPRPISPSAPELPKPKTSVPQEVKETAIGGAIGGAILGAIVGAILGAIVGTIVGTIGGAIYGAIGGAIGGAILGAIGGAIEGAIGLAILGAIYGAILGASVGGIEGAIVGAIYGAIVGAIHGRSAGRSAGGSSEGVRKRTDSTAFFGYGGLPSPRKSHKRRSGRVGWSAAPEEAE